MTGFMYSPGCKCCSSCKIYEGRWYTEEHESANCTEVAGEWTIATDSDAVETEDSQARLQFDTPHPGGIASVILEFKFSCDTDGDTARAWLCDSLFVEVEVAEDGCGNMRLLQSELPANATGSGSIGDHVIGGAPAGGGGSAEVELASTPIEHCYLDTEHLLRACYHYGDAVALQRFVGHLVVDASSRDPATDIYPNTFTLDEQNVEASGTHVGVATGDTVNGTVSFGKAGFKVIKHKSDNWPDCPDCLYCAIHEDPDWGGDYYTGTPPTLSCNWLDEAGTWQSGQAYAGAESGGSIVKAVKTEDSGARLIQQVEHSEHADNQYMEVYSGFRKYLDTHRYYLCYEDDADTIMLEIKYASQVPLHKGLYPEWSGHVKIYDGGTEVASDEEVWLGYEPYFVTFCIQEVGDQKIAIGKIYCSDEYGVLDTTEPDWIISARVSSRRGVKYGVGTGTIHDDNATDLPAYSGIGAYFGYPVFERSYNTANPDCVDCNTAACPQCDPVPSSWTVYASGFFDGECDECMSINGTYILSEVVSLCKWRSADVNLCGIVVYWELEVTDAASGSTQIDVTFVKQYTGEGGGITTVRSLWRTTTALACSDITGLQVPQWNSFLIPECNPPAGTANGVSVTANP
jgi:hypothetical protein